MSKKQFADMSRTNRTMNFAASSVGSFAYLNAAARPTVKQKAFYNKLYAQCKQANLPTCRHNGDRRSYAYAISNMLNTLKEAEKSTVTDKKEEAAVC